MNAMPGAFDICLFRAAGVAPSSKGIKVKQVNPPINIPLHGEFHKTDTFITFVLPDCEKEPKQNSLLSSHSIWPFYSGLEE